MFYQKIANKLSIWRDAHRMKARNKLQRDINRMFQVSELKGSLYLTCNGLPYKKISDGETSLQITERLEDARKTMLSYVECKQSEGEPMRNIGSVYTLAHAE